MLKMPFVSLNVVYAVHEYELIFLLNQFLKNESVAQAQQSVHTSSHPVHEFNFSKTSSILYTNKCIFLSICN